MRSGSLLVESFVGALFVELSAEAIEALLLPAERSGWRPRGLLFEGSVHTLVPTVLLRVTGLDELVMNAKPDPPDREPAEPSNGQRREGNTVVREYALRETILPEEPLEYRLRALMRRRAKRLAAEEVARASIASRQWVAILAVACLEFALVVDTPRVVGSVHRRGRLASVAGVLLTSPLLDQSMAREKIADRGSRWPDHRGMSLPQYGQELLRTPVGMPAAQLENRFSGFEGGRPGTPLWPS